MYASLSHSILSMARDDVRSMRGIFLKFAWNMGYGPEAMCFDYNGIYASRSGPKNKSAPQLRLYLTLDFPCNAVFLRIIHRHFSLSERFLFPSHMQKVFENVYFLYDE